MALTLTTDERAELERRVRSLKIRAEDARRARVILMLAHGDSYSTIEATVPCYRDYINRWRRRFPADRLEGLRPRYRGQPPTVLTPAMEARVLAKTQQPPPDGNTHWRTRKLGRVLKIHHNLVAKTWHRAGLQPHRFERYMQSDDPDFQPQVLRRPQPARQSARLRDRPRRRREDGHSGAGPPRSRAAAVARPRRAPRLRVIPAQHAVALRRAQYPVGRGARADGAAAHQHRVCRLPRRHPRQSTEAASAP